MMKILILGAGPAGLAFAARARDNGHNNIIVAEAETEAGGLCRSVAVDGAELDLGGGHFLDTARHEVVEFLFQYMPKEEWNLFERDSKINLFGAAISHPLEANIWQLPEGQQLKFLKSIFAAGCNQNRRMPAKFMEWIEWKLGDAIANEYMLPYNRKIFGDELNALGTYWLEKLPDVSFDESLLSCIRKKALGSQPGHATFFYPRCFGYGEVWRRMADVLAQHIIYGQRVSSLDVREKEATFLDGTKIKADIIVNTTPWKTIELVNVSDDVKRAVKLLVHNSITVDYYPDNYDSDAHWIYEPSMDVSHHRYLLRNNFLPHSKGFWTETNTSRDSLKVRAPTWSHVNEFAYPLNTIKKPVAVEKILGECRKYSIFGLGRWGEHEHYNSDVTVQKSLLLADTLTG